MYKSNRFHAQYHIYRERYVCVCVIHVGLTAVLRQIYTSAATRGWTDTCQWLSECELRAVLEKNEYVMHCQYQQMRCNRITSWRQSMPLWCHNKVTALIEIYVDNDQLYKSLVYDNLRTFIMTVTVDWKRGVIENYITKGNRKCHKCIFYPDLFTFSLSYIFD